MAITMMCDPSLSGRPNVRRVDDYHGHEAVRVSHGHDCPHRGEDDLSGAVRPECAGRRCAVLGPLFLETTHVGRVLALGERNGRDDSDFYALVWSPETVGPGQPTPILQIEYASTRGWTYPNGAQVDATPEVLEAYAAFRREMEDRRRREAEEAEARRPLPGRTVRVASGRKVPPGTVARCFWAGDTRHGARVGIELPDGSRAFLDASRVDVVPA